MVGEGHAPLRQYFSRRPHGPALALRPDWADRVRRGDGEVVEIDHRLVRADGRVRLARRADGNHRRVDVVGRAEAEPFLVVQEVGRDEAVPANETKRPDKSSSDVDPPDPGPR
jgi:hypothetical protein